MKRLIRIIALLFSMVMARDLNFKLKFILVLNLKRRFDDKDYLDYFATF